MTAEELFRKIAKELPEGKESSMFGAPCIKAPNGKAAAMYYKGDMVFKLKGEAEKEALSLDGAGVFSPMADRAMNGWIQLPFKYADRWKEFAAIALEEVSKLEPNKKKTKK
jgi:hypothetical protein